MQGVTRNMVTKIQQEEAVREASSEFADLRDDFTSVERGDFASLKTDLEKIEGEVDKLREAMAEETARVHGGIRLDINLDKARVKDEATALGKEILAADSRIDREIEGLQDRMKRIDQDLKGSLSS
jgi:hypothetical protein